MDIIASGLAFAEAPRWHDGAFWFSDMHDDRVFKILASGSAELVCKVDGRPSGLGWLPGGDMLIVSMTDRQLLRRGHDGAMSVHADLSDMIGKRANDMVVDRCGRAYVGNFGFHTDEDEPVAPTILVRVDPDGTVHQAADQMVFPNGTVITPNGKVLIIAETYAARLTAFDIDEDGGLSNRRIWAQFTDGSVPDGIALDEEGAVWVASPTNARCVRVREGGEILQTIDTGQQAFACALGGDDRKTLYIAIADSADREDCRAGRNGKVITTRVEIAGAGLP
ncbi:SMP-30/gluconolactonase/LRE family protein [Pontixanthobacter gangjinensis]|uniref:Gluconolaconase n=1 Tax=Pontixanthobacter gangjinensis TaxID=1028742 RepID=A0A6I4SQH5_9SPHN|nr:SMP-30/gluconolactonase/LRE family protein [Pontixanthobacter gangjinensis]MXO57628.1 gluconolaconase [Pontixanthobacter gangjinensis]